MNDDRRNGNPGTHFHLSVYTSVPLRVSGASLGDSPISTSGPSLPPVVREGRWVSECVPTRLTRVSPKRYLGDFFASESLKICQTTDYHMPDGKHRPTFDIADMYVCHEFSRACTCGSAAPIVRKHKEYNFARFIGAAQSVSRSP